MANTNLNVVGLDYEEIKTNLIAFMRTQPTFKDYDFSGAGLNALISLLAYNTHLNAWYLNMIGNEMFLDTAQKRSSVVSHARMLGYVPRSVTSAQATISVTIGAEDTPTSVTIPKYTEFTTVIDNVPYSFYTTGATTITRTAANQVYYTANVAITEGAHLTHRFTADNSNTSQRFVLPNANVDYSTISVAVITSSDDDTQVTYSRGNTAVGLNGNSTVYFVYETYNGLTELQFGDGVVGKLLDSGNIVVVDYFISSGDGPNKANTFAAPAAISGYPDVTVTLADSTEPAQGGQAAESVESTQYLAPLTYETQGRCVTAQDFLALIRKEVGGIDSIAVWGGEDGDPRNTDNSPIYGRVFISIKPTGSETLTEGAKARIKSAVLKNRAVVTISPEIIDPDFIYLNLNALVKYDATATSDSEDEISDTILSNMTQFANTELGKYGSYFRFSKFLRMVDDSHDSIRNSLITITLEKRVDVSLSTRNNYSLNLGNALFNGGNTATVTSNTQFSHPDENGVVRDNCFIENVGTTLRIFRFSSVTKTTVRNSIGTVDFINGKISLVGFEPTVLNDDADRLIIRAVPATSDIIPRQNQLIQLVDDAITITMYDDNQTQTATGTTGSQVTGGGQTGGGGFVVEV